MENTYQAKINNANVLKDFPDGIFKINNMAFALPGIIFGKNSDYTNYSSRFMIRMDDKDLILLKLNPKFYKYFESFENISFPSRDIFGPP